MYYTSSEVYSYIGKVCNDPIVEWRTCNISGSAFAVYQSDLDFYQKVGPVFDTQRFILPTPTLCREERMRKRLAWRNNLSFHKDTCDRTNKPIISIYSGHKPYKVYHQDIRRSDVRSPLDYGKDFDFSKTFREQYNQLMLEVPRMGMVNVNTSNSQYANYVKDAKDCYMTAVTYYGAEDLVYSFRVMDGHNGSDLMYCHHIHQSYQCTSSINITKCAYIHECNDCSYCQYSISLHGCEHCFMCNDLHNKKFCFQNKQLTKEEYEKAIIEYKKDHTADEMYKQFRDIYQQKNLRATSNQNCENSIGTGMKDCSNTRFCFIGEANQDSKFLIGEHTTDCMDMTGGTCEYVYECINTGLPGTNNILGSSSIVECNHMYFCDNCYSNSHHCFGSIGLRNTSYCICNKQYTKHEREKMCNRIMNHMKDTGEWGNFFPSIYAPFSYNESQGFDRYPIGQLEAEKLGYTRYNTEKANTTKSEFSPKPIEHYNPSIVGYEIAELNRKELLSAVITCPVTQKNFRITNTEIELCCKLHISLPNKHPELRYKERYSLLSPNEIHMRQCSETGQFIASCYGPGRKNKVIADQVFDKKMYG